VLVLRRGSRDADRQCEEIRKDMMHMHIMARRRAAGGERPAAGSLGDGPVQPRATLACVNG
jgi:hypothetical protein